MIAPYNRGICPLCRQPRIGCVHECHPTFLAMRRKRPPMRICAVRQDELEQLWFSTNIKRARAVASLLARIAPVEMPVELQLVATELPRTYQPRPTPALIDPRSSFGKSNLPYSGPMSFKAVDTYEGRGQQFTPAEKARTFLNLKAHISAEYWGLLLPVGAMLRLPRTELPPNRAMKQMMKEAVNG
jgi:hypothetical protein